MKTSRPQGDFQSIEVENGIKYTTISTATYLILVIEPEESTDVDFKPILVFMASPLGDFGVTTDSDCYTCWRRYFKCIFDEGSDIDECIEIGLECQKICGEGQGILFAPTTVKAISSNLRNYP